MSADPSVAGDAPRPLRHLPVVALTEPELLDIVRAGVRRAGGDPSVLTTSATDTDALRSSRTGGHDVVIALCGAAAVMQVLQLVRELGGRPIPVLSLSVGEAGPRVLPASVTLLSDASLRDLEIPVPALEDDAMRTMLWDQLRHAHAEERHHLVEVDGRPALEELGMALGGGRGFGEHGWAFLAAGAAGVLAGRLAASNRRWRAQLDA
jgi:hypothetical protein